MGEIAKKPVITSNLQLLELLFIYGVLQKMEKMRCAQCGQTFTKIERIRLVDCSLAENIEFLIGGYEITGGLTPVQENYFCSAACFREWRSEVVHISM